VGDPVPLVAVSRDDQQVVIGSPVAPDLVGLPLDSAIEAVEACRAEVRVVDDGGNWIDPFDVITTLALSALSVVRQDPCRGRVSPRDRSCSFG